MDSKCKINHPLEDVKQKYESQRPFLPSELEPMFDVFFQGQHTQDILNEVFHLLKKFDLSPTEEKEHRVKRLQLVLTNLS